jgi:hypothetical protein
LRQRSICTNLGPVPTQPLPRVERPARRPWTRGRIAVWVSAGFLALTLDVLLAFALARLTPLPPDDPSTITTAPTTEVPVPPLIVTPSTLPAAPLTRPRPPARPPDVRAPAVPLTTSQAPAQGSKPAPLPPSTPRPVLTSTAQPQPTTTHTPPTTTPETSLEQPPSDPATPSAAAD